MYNVVTTYDTIYIYNGVDVNSFVLSDSSHGQ